MSNSLSRNGSATVQWVDGSNVIIKNFHVRSDGTLLVNVFDGKNWSTFATTITGIQTSDLHKGGALSQSQSAISAFSVNIGTSSHRIHVFYPTAGQVIKSSIWQVSSNTWVPDSGFNAQNFVGNPRAAITWKDSNGVTQYRVYFVAFTSQGQQPLILPFNVYEILGTDGGSWQISNNNQPIIGPIRQNGSAFGDAVAALTWMSTDKKAPGQQIRIYIYQGLWLVEYIYVQGTGWVQGENLDAGFQDQSRRYPVAAVQFVKSGMNNIRLYRNTYLPLEKNFATEWAWDQGSGKWRTNKLPPGVIHNTDGSMQPSAVAWTDPTDDSQVHIRLYQNRDNDDNGNPGIWIEESLYDTSHGNWVPNTGILDGVRGA